MNTQKHPILISLAAVSFAVGMSGCVDVDDAGTAEQAVTCTTVDGDTFDCLPAPEPEPVPEPEPEPGDVCAAIPALACDTSVEALVELAATVDQAHAAACDGEVVTLDPCSSDLLDQIGELHRASDCTSEVQALIDRIGFEASSARWCEDQALVDGETLPPPPSTTCVEVDWDRLGPPPPLAGDCSVIAVTSSVGSWTTSADLTWGYPTPSVPGTQLLPLSAWERQVDELGRPLWPADELLSSLGVDAAEIGYLQAPGAHQMEATLDLRPLEAQLAAGRVMVLYGRSKAAVAYVAEAEPPPGWRELAYYHVTGELASRRDSIKILDCDAAELAGERAFTLSATVAGDDDQPWSPLAGEVPGVWAAFLSCQPDVVTPTHDVAVDTRLPAPI